MYYDDNIKHYGDVNYLINKKYCEKYKIEIIVSHEKNYRDRHSAWERLPFLIANIEKYDYLIWIDADAFFYNDATNICDVINNNSSHDFIFSKDLNQKTINTGFFIVKNTPYSVNFLTKWAYDKNLYYNNPFPEWWDQGVLVDMMEKNDLDINNHCVSFEYGVLQHFFDYEIAQSSNKPFVFHLAGRSHNERLKVSKKYLDTITINENENSIQ
jgi:hypothetical protein